MFYKRDPKADALSQALFADIEEIRKSTPVKKAPFRLWDCCNPRLI